MVHGIHVIKSGKHDAILTASFLGIHRYELGGGTWKRTEVSKGDPAPWPKSGSSDIAQGKGYLAAIEPWHGGQVVIYEKGQRQVIDTTLDQGHTIQIVADGIVVAGHRGPKGGVNLYTRIKGTWTKTVLDEALKANSCEVGDLNGDGIADIACIGGPTANLKVYLRR